MLASTVQGDEQSTAGPYIAHLESQYSWAHMDPSAHSLAFRGGAEVPRPSTAKVQSYTGGQAPTSRPPGTPTRNPDEESTAPNPEA